MTSRPEGRSQPRARRRGLIVERMRSETLVYDVERDKAHCLPPLLAAVWRRCDGRTSPEAIARAVARSEHVDVDVPLVSVALHRLARARLLEPGALQAPASASRREVLRRAAALGGLAVLSIVAPTAADAATCTTGAACALLPDGTCSTLPCCNQVNTRCCSNGPGPCTCRTTGACHH